MWICPKCKESIEDQFDSCWKCAGGAQVVDQTTRQAKPLVSFQFLMGLAIVVQLWLAAAIFLDTGPSPLRTSFRREQRRAALEAYSRDRSPENRAAWQEEIRLASGHVSRARALPAGIVLALFAGADIIVIFLRKQHHARNTVPI